MAEDNLAEKTALNLLELLRNSFQTQGYLDERGKMLKEKLLRDARENAGEIIRVLLKVDELRCVFLVEQGEYLVFNRERFIDYVLDKNFLAGSYTKYRNKIGLHDAQDYLLRDERVLLAFPFKDCVLQGGQTRDEQKSQELFFNEVLSHEQIDRLFDPKVFANALTIRGENQAVSQEPVIKLNRDKDGRIKDNLLIKGNNLIALHSLARQFRAKVKLIYIDPPYNTGGDSFQYNDRFNHSTWLCFMKNRLEIARELLREDGVIVVQCDDNEQAYLKVLLDEIFGRENFANTVVWQKKFSPANDAKYFSDNHDFILFYAKTKEQWQINNLPRTEEMNARYKNPDNDPRGPWISGDLTVKTYSVAYDYGIITPRGQEVFPPKGRCWFTSKEKMLEIINDNKVCFPKGGNNVPRLKRFLTDVKDGVTPLTIWKYDEVGHTQDARREIKKLFASDDAPFASPKPEKLLCQIIQISTQPGDIVLDFFAGSGTTAAVAHKMGRQWIAVEQMDYIENVSKARMEKVLCGEQGGISKVLDWQGGGSFIYCELARYNQYFADSIGNAENTGQLQELHAEIQENAYTYYHLQEDQLLSEDPDFLALSLAEQKKCLLAMLDLNQLYIPYTERKDVQHKQGFSAIGPNDIAFSENFYEGKD